jgi:hypothetical protein
MKIGGKIYRLAVGMLFIVSSVMLSGPAMAQYPRSVCTAYAYYVSGSAPSGTLAYSVWYSHWIDAYDSCRN